MSLGHLTNDPIREFQQRLHEQHDRAESKRPIVRACQDAIQRAESKAIVSLDDGSSGVGVMITVPVKKLDDLIPLFRELAKEGLKTDKSQEPEDTKLMDVIGIRKYKLGAGVILTAFLLEGDQKGSGDGNCRMVQTGVKEVPVYGVQCD